MPLSASILARVKYQHETVSELIEGFSESQLKQRGNPDKWSIFENIVHLASYQPSFISRLKLILEGNTPKFERYVAEKDPLFDEYLKKDLRELLEDVSANRAIIIKNLLNLNEDQLKMKGEHPKFGLMSVSQWADLFLLHEAHHLWTMEQLIGPFRAAK
jgi:hypothetical protein